ncbi:MAG: hypothetical protein H8E66_18315 [Planctomycetes bacterium]|nr:hypothetical protein [Planctomycetota bacterium]
MLRKLFCIGLLTLVSSSLGCAMCCSPDDCNYGAYGGRWQRHDMSCGRVGSAFAEAGYDSLGEVMQADAIEPPQPLPADDNIRAVGYDEELPQQVSSYID